MAKQRDVPALLADVARIGPFFAVATGAAPPGGGWTALRALGAPAAAAEVDPLRDRITAVGDALGCDRRVAASTAFQGLAAQLVAPLFAAVVVHGALPARVSVAPAASWPHVVVPGGPRTATGDHEAVREGLAGALHWRPGGAGPWLWWAGPGRVVACPDDLLADVLAGLLAPVVAAMRARASVSPRVLWGDAASAVAAARGLVAAALPASARRATAVAGHLLTAPPLAVTAALRPPEPPDVAWSFRRRSCCLYYRVPGGGVCGDCVLHDRGRRWAEAPGRRAGPAADGSPRLARSVAPPSSAP